MLPSKYVNKIPYGAEFFALHCISMHREYSAVSPSGSTMLLKSNLIQGCIRVTLSIEMQHVLLPNKSLFYMAALEKSLFTSVLIN